MSPDQIGPYKVLGVLGKGGMGNVYRALDQKLGREVAVKQVSAIGHFEDEMLKRFLTEARAAARLNHPNIVTVYELGEDAGVPYIAMEILTGFDLDALMKSGEQVGFDEKLDIVSQVCRGLAFAHDQGIVHRDIKPGNIRLTEDGAVKILDFGVAKLNNEQVNTQAGALVGTVHYMSPEQVRGERVDGRSDIYSVGTILYELCSGQRPFSEGSTVEVLYKTVHEAPRAVDFAALGPLASRMSAVLEKSLAKDPNDRYHSAATLGHDLDSLVVDYQAAWTGERVAPSPAALKAIAEARRAIRQGDVATATRELESVLAEAPDLPEARWLMRTVRIHSMKAPNSEPEAHPAAVTSVGHAPPPPALMPSPPRPAAAAKVAIQPDTTMVGGSALRSPAPSPWPGTVLVPPPAVVPGPPPVGGEGATVGRFVLHEEIARGQSGTLYKAYDPVRGRLIGVKLVFGGDPEAKKRLLRGARIWLDLRHPNLVRVLEVHPDYHGYTGVIVSELVDGVDLDQLTKGMRLSLEQVIDIGLQICDGLSHIHALGVVHREVRPRNLLLTVPGLRVTLLDSGIARHANRDIDAFTRTGIVVGDLSFAAPEQIQGEVDQRVDIFALGAILCQLLTGKKRSISEVREGADPFAGSSTVPSRLRLALKRALDPVPDRRFTSIQEFADHLRGFAPSHGSRQVPSVNSVVVTLHGIRTNASWQRSFAEVAASTGLQARLDRWNFGYFSVIRFMLPRARLGRVRWFRKTYEREFPHMLGEAGSTEAPSIIAHSFGTYILGNALLRYPYLRFRRVVLCGSILPREFPWDQIIERGQVQAVRNEYGTEDVWTNLVAWFVRGTGPSGLVGFGRDHERLEQERFTFSHGEYFERAHMQSRWLPFLTMHGEVRPLEDRSITPSDTDRRPWGLYGLYALIVAGVVVLARLLLG